MGTVPFVFFIVSAVVIEVLFLQFLICFAVFVLLCNGLSIADKDVCIMDTSLIDISGGA